MDLLQDVLVGKGPEREMRMHTFGGTWIRAFGCHCSFLVLLWPTVVVGRSRDWFPGKMSSFGIRSLRTVGARQIQYGLEEISNITFL